MDAFRAEQKKVSHDYSKHPSTPHGCPCCRKHRDLASHKRYARKIARHRLKQSDIKEKSTIQDESLI